MHKLLTGSLQVDRITVGIADLPSTLEGSTIVQLSDFHYDGVRLSEELLSEAIAASNRAKPDLVVLTGDYITDDPTPIAELGPRLQQLRSRLGIYAVLGNHDLHRRGAKAIVTEALEQFGISVLWNQIAYPFGPEFPLVGLADYWSKAFDPQPVLDQLDPSVPRIVLSHNPDSAAKLQAWRVDLQLSGHTHGGQVVIPGLGPIGALADAYFDYVPRSLRRWIPYARKGCHKVIHHWHWTQGLHKIGHNLLYINRGLGTYPPGRLFCSPEVTVITVNQKRI
jgi:hypothetical protein